MDPVCYQPIGLIRTPFTQTAGMPIQSVAAQGTPGRIEIYPEHGAGLQDIEGFSYLWLIYHLHQVESAQLTVKPFLDDQTHGVFATRSPKRPNPIGLSVVKLARVEGLTLHIEDVDILDGTPLLDVKPYVPLFDQREAESFGWFMKTVDRVYTTRAD